MSSELRETLRFLQQENVRLQKENLDLHRQVNMLNDVLDALRSLQEVSASVGAHTDAFNLLDRILQSALVSIRASDGSLLLADDETGELAFVVVYGAVRDSLTGHRIPLGEGIAGWVAQKAEPVIIRDAKIDSRFSQTIDEQFQFQTRSLLCVPIVSGTQVLGVIQALNKADMEEFNRGDLALLGIVAQLAATAITRAEAAIPAEE